MCLLLRILAPLVVSSSSELPSWLGLGLGLGLALGLGLGLGLGVGLGLGLELRAGPLALGVRMEIQGRSRGDLAKI